jgi:hypothetical protein
MEMNIDLAQEIIGNIFKAAKGSKKKPYIVFEMQAWKYIRAWIKERHKTVATKSAAQQLKQAIALVRSKSKTLPACNGYCKFHEYLNFIEEYYE